MGDTIETSPKDSPVSLDSAEDSTHLEDAVHLRVVGDDHVVLNVRLGRRDLELQQGREGQAGQGRAQRAQRAGEAGGMRARPRGGAAWRRSVHSVRGTAEGGCRPTPCTSTGTRRRLHPSNGPLALPP